LAQDDYYYEIQLTNKQLVFYFLAGATGLILSFLAGVMVGKGVDAPTAEARDRPVRERVVPEEPNELAADQLTYSQRLEDGEPRATLEPAPSPAQRSTVAATATPRPQPTAPRATPSPTPTPTPAPTPAPKAEPSTPSSTPGSAVGRVPPEAAGTFTIQVGAFKDRGTADTVMARLKGKGYTAFVVPPDGSDGLFLVRVGRFVARADAERTEARLRDQEKFKPYIVKN
jgi:cell division septation protein DedD